MHQRKTGVQKSEIEKVGPGIGLHCPGAKKKNLSDLVSSAGFHQLPVCLLSLRPIQESQVNYSPKPRLMKPPLKKPELVCPPPQCHNLTTLGSRGRGSEKPLASQAFLFPISWTDFIYKSVGSGR